jgi:hypothetical protein
MRELVRRGYGFALIREGSKVDDELTTRPVAGVNWMVSIAVVYNQQRHPKTIPVLVRHLKRHLAGPHNKEISIELVAGRESNNQPGKPYPRSVNGDPTQLSLRG